MTKLLLTKAEAAEALSISNRQLELYVNAGEIAVHRLGRRCVRIEASELERFIQRIGDRNHNAQQAATRLTHAVE